jgi:hypothetical protein
MSPLQQENQNQDNIEAWILPGAPKGALCEWLAGSYNYLDDSDDEQEIDEDDLWWNEFTMTHGFLSETKHSDVPDNATFAQVTGSWYDIKTFLESSVEAPGNIIYTSTPHFIPHFIFKMLPLKREREWKNALCNLKFDYLGDVTADKWTQFFAPYGLELTL